MHQSVPFTLRLFLLKLGDHILTITHFHTLVPCVNTVAELRGTFPGSMLSLMSLTVSLAWATQQQQLACSSRVGRWFQTGGTGAILTWNSLQQNKTSLTPWHPQKKPHCELQQTARCVFLCVRPTDTFLTDISTYYFPLFLCLINEESCSGHIMAVFWLIWPKRRSSIASEG